MANIYNRQPSVYLSPTSLSAVSSAQATIPPVSNTQATLPSASSNQTTVPPSSNNQATVPPASSNQATVPPASSNQATVPPASSNQATVPPTSSNQATVPPASSNQTTVPSNSSNQATAPLVVSYEPDLVQYYLPGDELECGEYSFKLAVDFSKRPKAGSGKNESKDTDPKIHILTVILCALGMTCGGLCTVVDVSGKRLSNPTKILGDWKQKLQDHFTNILGDMYRKCIKYKQYGDRGLHILVKTFSQFVSVCSNVYIRHDESAMLENKDTHLACLLEHHHRQSAELQTLQNLSAHIGQIITLPEDENLEYKLWTNAVSLNDYKHKFQKKRTRRAIISLMNELDGGTLLAGVEDSSHKVIGQQLDLQTQTDLTAFLQTYIEGFFVVCQDPSQTITLSRGVYYEIDYQEVMRPGKMDHVRRVLIILRFAPCGGLVCGKLPEAVHLIWLLKHHHQQSAELHRLHNFSAHIGQILTLPEDENLEYKLWTSAVSLNDYKHKFQEKRTRKAIISLMNELDGGTLLAGVKDSSHKVIGQQLDLQTQTDLTAFLQTYIEGFFVVCQDPSQTITLSRGVHYEINYQEVTRPGQIDPVRQVLIILRFAPCGGLVCDKLPEAYTITHEGFIKRLSTAEWVQNILISRHDHAILPEENSSDLAEVNNKTLPLHSGSEPETASAAGIDNQSIQSTKDKKTSFLKRLFTARKRKPTRSQDKESQDPNDVQNVQEEKDFRLNQILQKEHSLQRSKEKPNWVENVATYPKDYGHSIRAMLDEPSILQLERTVNFIPSRDVIVEGCGFASTEDIKMIISDIEDYCESRKAVAIAQNSWLALLPETHSYICPPPGHIMDVLVLTDVPQLHFLVVLNDLTDITRHEKQRGYLFQTARLLKKYILQGLKKDKYDICFGISLFCRLCGPNGHVIEGQYQDMITATFNTASSCTSDDLRAALARLLLSKDTWLKHDLDTTKGIKMSVEQLQPILKSFGIPANFTVIEGPPGCGKSYMGLGLMGIYPHQTAWVAPTEPFKLFLESHGARTVFLISNDSDMKSLLDKKSLINYHIVIIDDVHHINCSKRSWKRMFAIVERHNLCLFMLQDNSIQNYRGSSDTRSQLVEFCKKRGIPCNIFPPLTVMYRNERIIHSFIKECAGDKGSMISSANTNDGHEVEIRKIHNLRVESEHNGLVQLLLESINPQKQMVGEATAYRENDIAILVDGEDSDEAVLFVVNIIKKFVTAKVHTATVQPPTSITVEYVERFMGLESRMCIFLTAGQQSGSATSLENPCYQAYLASRAISRAVFLVEELTVDVARTFHFGDLDRNIPAVTSFVGLEYLIKNGVLRNTPEDIAEFLFKGEGLSKRAIGDYLGERNDFNISVLKAFVNLHEFSDMLIVQALRQFLWSFRLPGEAQTHHMMECFAQRYCELNPQHFSTTDTCYVLSIAIIMLNTSLHNSAVKDKPSVERFIHMNRGINDGKDIPPDLLTRVYDNIQKEPFKIPKNDGDDLIHTFFNPDKEGWLWKQGGRYKTWKRRWFLLKDHCLYYFEFTQDKEPKGIIPLDNIKIRETNDRDKHNCFELYAANNDLIKACKTNSDGKVVEGKHTVYMMSATATEEKEQWIQCIQQSIKSFYSILAARRKKVQHEK